MYEVYYEYPAREYSLLRAYKGLLALTKSLLRNNLLLGSSLKKIIVGYQFNLILTCQGTASLVNSYPFIMVVDARAPVTKNDWTWGWCSYHISHPVSGYGK